MEITLNLKADKKLIEAITSLSDNLQKIMAGPATTVPEAKSETEASAAKEEKAAAPAAAPAAKGKKEDAKKLKALGVKARADLKKVFEAKGKDTAMGLLKELDVKIVGELKTAAQLQCLIDKCAVALAADETEADMFA